MDRDPANTISSLLRTSLSPMTAANKALFAAVMGLSDVRNNEEIVFAGSLSIVLFLMWHLTKELGVRERNQLFGTAFVIFAFRAVPTTGAGETWWMIDVLDFDCLLYTSD